MKYIIMLLLTICMAGFSQSKNEQSFALSSTIDEQDPPENIQVDTMPRPTSYTAPKYPESARKLGIEGEVWLKLVVDEKGNASKISVVRSHIINNEKVSGKNVTSKEAYAALDDLTAAAIEAAKNWKFNPAVLNGKQTKVWVTLPFKFKLDSSKPGKK